MTNQPNTPPITGAEQVTFNYRQKDNKTGFDILLALDRNHYAIGFSLDDDHEAENVTRLLNAGFGTQLQQAFIPVVFDFQLETRLNRHRLILHTPICSFQTGILLSPDEESTRKITLALNRKTALDPKDYASVIAEALHREFGPDWKARLH